MLNGFINLNKPSGISSNKALGILKHALREAGIKEKIGHLGTLDPLATGVLPVAIGRATRLFDYSLDKVKVYEADFILGAESVSLDTDTEVKYGDFSLPPLEAIVAALKKQEGEILQKPPVFSAKSVGGVRAYKLARLGEEVDLPPKKVSVYEVRLLKVSLNTVTVEIRCGGGTYVRAIGRDFAAELGTTAVMSRLVRKQSGMFCLENSLPLSVAENDRDALIKSIIPLAEYVSVFDKYVVSDIEKKKLLNGVSITPDRAFEGIRALYCGDELIGLAERDIDGGIFVRTWLL